MVERHHKIFFFFLLIFLFIFPANSFAEKIFVIDPGHGGKYTGTCGATGNQTRYCERDANLSVGLKVREILRYTDIKVVMTRDTDRHFAPESQNADLTARMLVANAAVKNNNDNSLFISIHHNGSPSGPHVRGIETYFYDNKFLKPAYPPDPIQVSYFEQSKRLAEIIHPKLVSSLGLINRGIKNESLYVIRNAQMPAALVELGYMTNKEEEAIIKTDSFQQKAAQTIANTAIEYFKVFEVQDNNGKILKIFKTKQEAINYADHLVEAAMVFDKDKQQYVYFSKEFDVYHRTDGLLKSFNTETAAINYAKGWRNTHIISLENDYTIWSNYLDKKYDVYINGQVSQSFFDYAFALAFSQGKTNVKIMNNKTNEVLWTNIPNENITFDVTNLNHSGIDRIETGVAVSKSMYPNGFPQEKQNKVVLLATGYEFADALSAGPLAGYYDKAPILLTHADFLDSATKQEILRLGAEKVVIIGGTGAVSKEIENTLFGMKLSVERISGIDRYETSFNILKKIGNVNGLFVVYGHNFPDALSVSPIAANKNWGILLARTDEVTPLATMNLDNKKIVIAGGTSVVSDNVKNKLATQYPTSTIVRLFGKDRYETNAKILWHFNDNLAANNLSLTTGTDFPDALTAAPLSIGTNSPLVLVGDKLNKNIESFLLFFGSTNKVSKMETIGGIVSNQSAITVSNKLK